MPVSSADALRLPLMGGRQLPWIVVRRDASPPPLPIVQHHPEYHKASCPRSAQHVAIAIGRPGRSVSMSGSPEAAHLGPGWPRFSSWGENEAITRGSRRSVFIRATQCSVLPVTVGV